MRTRAQSGFTVIELLVTISIIGMLMALLFPAIQAAREAARRNTCKNHLRQLGLAVFQHETLFTRLPSGGWGFQWYGEPGRGTGQRQPGGWTYNILAYVERNDLAVLGRGGSIADKRAAVTLLNQRPLDVFNCPSRRGLDLGIFDSQWPPHNADLTSLAAKTDYAINAGDVLIRAKGPKDLAEADSGEFKWSDFSEATGVCYYRSQVAMAHILDGKSNTYLIGEKYVISGGGPDLGDDQSLYVGYDLDNCRWTTLGWTPLRDDVFAAADSFGSNHVDVCQFVMCDGAVREISFGIDQEVHRRLGNRKDRLPIDEKDFAVGR